MSYDIKLTGVCDNKVVWDDHIVEDDLETVILGMPVLNSNVVVRVNDFKRAKDQQTEILLREDVSSQVTGTNKSFYVSQGPIYNGLKIGQKATRFDDVTVRIRVEQEDVSGQFTGQENFFYTQARPLLRLDEFDFNSFVQTNDVEIMLNGEPLDVNQINSIDATLGKVNLNFVPVISDIITVTYNYRAKITFLDATQARLEIKETPTLGQKVFIAYYSRQANGWHIENSKRAMIEKSKDIIFYEKMNTNRFFVQNEDVSAQFTGIEKVFQTEHYPLLPLFQNFKTTPDETLNNAALVYINGARVSVASISSEDGKITLHQIPAATDVVTVSYYYQAPYEPDRISVDYYVPQTYCDKCSSYSDMIDYVIDQLGNYEKVRDEQKLLQDLKKIVKTDLGSDPVASWYGTSFNTLVGSKMFPEITRTKITNELVTALSKLKSLQVQQEEYQKMTGNEFLDTISKIDVQESTTIPTLYTADVEIITQAGKLVPTTEQIQTKG
jgi:phage baseplate assembly protein W